MKLLNLPQMYNFAILIYMYKTINIPNFNYDLVNILQILDSQHNHLTRNRDLYIVPRYNKIKSKTSINYIGIKLYNDIPSNLKNLPTIGRYKNLVRTCLLE